MRMISMAAAVLAAALAAGPTADLAASSGTPDPTRAAAPAVAGNGPAFLENGGRLPDAVDFTLDAEGRTFFFGPGGVTISLKDAAQPERGRWVLKLAPESARNVRPVAEDERPGVTSVFTGPRESWHVGMRSFGRLVYRDLWPGIDLVWRAEPGRLKWECRVHPGADPSAAWFTLRGAQSVSVGGDGALTASTPLGDFVDAAPVAWQIADGARTTVASAFELDVARSRFRIVVGAYDTARELVVDPSTAVRATYLGGAGDDVATAIAVDGARNTYVVGVTRSLETSFPLFAGPDLTFNGGTDDAFVTKLDAGLKVVWSGYMGGSNSDGAAAVAVDSFGIAYVAGYTQSPNFPGVGTLGFTPGGGYDAFVTRVASNGRSLAWSAVFGGPGEDRALGIAMDLLGHVVVAGRTAGNMPWGSGFYGGASDGFAMGLKNDGSLLEWGLYLGGSQADSCTGVAMDPARNVYLCGNTNSTAATFPVTVGPALFGAGGQDCFVAKLDATSHLPLYAGFVAGTAWDEVSGIVADPQGRAYIVGSTTSDQTTFPVTTGPHLLPHGKSDAFVARVAASGVGLEYCGFVGGTGDDFGYGIALDGSNRAILVGTTGSTEKAVPAVRAKFPVVDGPDLTFNGGIHDGWLGVVQPTGSQMATLGYVGGSSNIDDAVAVALQSNGDVLVAGDTASSAKTFPAGASSALAAGGGRNAFVVQYQFLLPSPVLLVPRLDAVSPLGFDLAVDWTDDDTNETGFEVQRIAPDGSVAAFPVATPAAPKGPVRFVDTTAVPGTLYTYRVRATDAQGKGEFSEVGTWTSTPSLALKLKKSSLGSAGVESGGTAAVAMKFAFQAGSATSVLDPVADGITITLSGAGADQVFTVPPNDPAWIVTGTAATWTTPGGNLTRIIVDTGKRTIRLDANTLTLAVPAARNAIRVLVTSGGSRGVSAAYWRAGGRGLQYRYP